jgi:ParB-like chromosome segregation protein Spo0J
MLKEISIGKLKEAAYNPRVPLVPGMPEFEKLKKSIEEFGNVEPIVWNEKTGNVVGGHQRLQVLKSLGYKKADCVVISASEAEEKVLNLALNKIKGDWDYAKLKAVLSDFDGNTVDLTGFGADEVALYLASDEGITEGNLGDYEPEEEDIYSSYVVTLKFDHRDDAKQWIEDHGYDAMVRENAGTTVIRMDE